MERYEPTERPIFTAKGFFVNQLLQEGWGWDAAFEHASQLFSAADGDQPNEQIVNLPICQHVKAYIAACDAPEDPRAQGDDYQPRIEELLPSMEVHT